jgi:putative effector of murein hydrolase
MPITECLGLQIAKVLLVTCLGLVYTLYSVAFSVLFLRKMSGKVAPPVPVRAQKKSRAVAAGPPPKPFSDETMTFLYKASGVLGLASLLTQTVMSDAAWGTTLRTAFFYTATFASYVRCARLPAAFTKAIHPLLTSTVVVWGLLYVFGVATGSSDFIESLKTYKTSSLAWNVAGAGDILLFCLGPSVVSFAVSMYSRKKLLVENFLIVVAAMLVSSFGGLFGTAAFTNLIRLGGSSGNALMIRLSMLARNITTSLAIPVTTILGGDISIAVVVVVLTGIFGAQFGRKLLDLVNIQDPITRGLAVGSAAQGLGVSSMASEADAFPFAAMAMALTAVAGTILVAIPDIKAAVISTCGN